jgi:pimeloyl-ACP methyl ester carboxylesterase
MRKSLAARLVVWPLALVGAATLAFAIPLAQPLESPPPLASVHDGAVAIDKTGMPDLSRFQARDGTLLAYRLYPAANGASDRLAILVHGSSGTSAGSNGVAKALAAAGVTAVAIDARGHGASGTRGDIGYLGQLDDDLADLVANLRNSYPSAKLVLIGHSAGGGFAARIAAGPLASEFERFILLAPYLGYRAPTNKPNEGAGRWVNLDAPRVVALAVLETLGVDWGQSLPTLAFAVAPDRRMSGTPWYSYRLMRNFASPLDWQTPFLASRGKMVVIAGENDELMDATGYRTALEPLGASVTILPGVDHMGVAYKPAAIAAIVAAAKQGNA